MGRSERQGVPHFPTNQERHQRECGRKQVDSCHHLVRAHFVRPEETTLPLTRETIEANVTKEVNEAAEGGGLLVRAGVVRIRERENCLAAPEAACG